jgi:hypothetical protein
MGGDNPVRVLGGVNEFGWHWFTGTPDLHRIIINGVSAAEDFRTGLGHIAMSAWHEERQQPFRRADTGYASGLFRSAATWRGTSASSSWR